MFTTARNPTNLVSADIIYGDGTFYASPTQFTQLYTLHAMVDDVMYPLVLVGRCRCLCRWWRVQVSVSFSKCIEYSGRSSFSYWHVWMLGVWNYGYLSRSWWRMSVVLTKVDVVEKWLTQIKLSCLLQLTTSPTLYQQTSSMETALSFLLNSTHCTQWSTISCTHSSLLSC
jgi:hypothetical protein